MQQILLGAERALNGGKPDNGLLPGGVVNYNLLIMQETADEVDLREEIGRMQDSPEKTKQFRA